MQRAWDFTVIVACALAVVLAVSGTLLLQTQKEARLTAERDAAVAALESKIALERMATESELARLQGQVGKSTTVMLTQEVGPQDPVEALVAAEQERASSQEAGIQWQVFDLQLRTVALELDLVESQLYHVGEQLRAIEVGLHEVEGLLAHVRRGLGLKPQA